MDSIPALLLDSVDFAPMICSCLAPGPDRPFYLLTALVGAELLTSPGPSIGPNEYYGQAYAFETGPAARIPDRPFLGQPLIGKGTLLVMCKICSRRNV